MGEVEFYNWVYIDIYPLDEFDGLCFFILRYYRAKSLNCTLPLIELIVSSSEETSSIPCNPT